MKVRPATKDDKAAIKKLITMQGNKLMQTHLPTYRSFFVAEQENMIVGCCALQVYSKRLAEVRSLSVHPDFSGNGVASKLVEACESRARQLGVVELLAITTQARGLFAKLNFDNFKEQKYALLKELSKSQKAVRRKGK